MSPIKSPAVSATVQEMVRRIVERFKPEKVILFGSHARGGARPDSDVDLLVVMKVIGSRRKVAAEIDFLLADRKTPLDVVVITPHELSRHQHTVGTVIYPAVHEGLVLYDRAA
jgi:uncharacterized protein